MSILRSLLVNRVRRDWDEFARIDPLWAILTDPAKKQTWELDEFFATGEADVALLFAQLDRLGVARPVGHALDFGCGVGRVARALAGRFDRVDGLDISEEMVRLARHFNRDCAACHFAVNSGKGRISAPSNAYDLVYCVLVLQHNSPALIKRFISELVRVLAPGGLLVFQLPGPEPEAPISTTHPLKQWLPRSAIRTYRQLRARVHRPFPYMAMHGMEPTTVAAVVTAARGRILHAVPDQCHGDTWPGFRYFVEK